jgi:hypothetical protein
MEMGLSVFGGALGIVALFGGIALLVWVTQKGEEQKRKLQAERDAQQREVAHVERMKALELGQPLPDADVARANAERTRARWIGIVGLVVPLGTAGLGLVVTVLVLVLAHTTIVPALGIVWGVIGLVSLVSVSLSLSNLQKINQGRLRAETADRIVRRDRRPAAAVEPDLREAIQE